MNGLEPNTSELLVIANPKVITTDLEDFVEMARALSSELRVNVFKALLHRPMNVAEIADTFDIPQSTAAVNVKKLEDVGLIATELVPGLRGIQKVCSASVARLIVDMVGRTEAEHDHVLIAMPVGQFVDCQVAPTCGLVSDTAIIGELDDPRSFYDPERVMAQLLWFGKGYVEYRFPNRLPRGAELRGLKLTMEICSEAPMHALEWPSDISVWINHREIGTWTSPSDFGGTRGFLTPDWWEIRDTQFGVMKTWQVGEDGSFVDGRSVSDCRLADLKIEEAPFIAVRIGIRPDAINQGGLNLFGRGFGNYENDLVLRLDYAYPERGGRAPSMGTP